MVRIELSLIINAPIQRCFDLSRSIDFHKTSTGKTNEMAVAGVTSGLIGLNEEVTWEATHFGVRQRLSSRITAFESPFHFRDEQVKGIFKSIKHDHYFEEKDNQTWMKDVFVFEAPFGILGRVVEIVLLKKYLKKFILKRNNLLKECAENDSWKIYLIND
jgi:ligand-binding SRPBCC domain-containing protein